MEEKWSITPEKTAMLACGAAGVVTHLFGLVNVLHNYDDIAQQPRGYGTGVTSGRWLLSLLGDFADSIGANYNLPVINGLLFIFLICCCAGLLVSVLNIKNRKMAALIGMLWIVFPSAFSTLVFRYTSVYYGIGILLGVFAAWVLNRHPYGLLLSALSIAFSMGIYQAYVPITISIFVLLLIQQALNGTARFRDLVGCGLRDTAALLLGLLFYYVFLNLTLKLYGTQLSDYQGVNEMGALSLPQMPGLIRKALYTFCMLPLKDYCGIASSRLIKIVYLLLAGVSAFLLVYILFKNVKKISVVLLTIALCAVFPIAVNFIVIMCPESWIYTLMVYSFVMVPCVPVILFMCIPSELKNLKIGLFGKGRGISGLIAVLICCYCYQSNVNYTALYFANRQIENYVSSLVTQVRMTKGFDSELEWVFLGEIEDPLLGCYWQYEMNYGGIEFTQWMLKRYSMPEWIHNYYGYELPMASEDTVEQMCLSPEVRSMPCWPDEGSIGVVGDRVVIKFQEQP